MTVERYYHIMTVGHYFHVMTVEHYHHIITEHYYCQRHGLAVPRAGDRSYVTGSIRGWSRSQLTYLTGGCWLEERKLTSQSPSVTVEFSVQYIIMSSKLGNRYLKSSAAAATAFWPKKQRRCRLPLLVYESSAAAASECKTAGAAARRCRYLKKKSKVQRYFNIIGLLVKLQLCWRK